MQLLKNYFEEMEQSTKISAVITAIVLLIALLLNNI